MPSTQAGSPGRRVVRCDSVSLSSGKRSLSGWVSAGLSFICWLSLCVCPGELNLVLALAGRLDYGIERVVCQRWKGTSLQEQPLTRVISYGIISVY